MNKIIGRSIELDIDPIKHLTLRDLSNFAFAGGMRVVFELRPFESVEDLDNMVRLTGVRAA